jgi:hypothetical protein
MWNKRSIFHALLLKGEGEVTGRRKGGLGGGKTNTR